MTNNRTRLRRTFALALWAGALFVAPITFAQTSGSAQLVTWTCTGGNCPWGSSLSGLALAWPEEAQPSSSRLGYTTTPAAYLPAAVANGATIWIDSGTATAFAGLPGAGSHRALMTITVGEFYTVSDLAPGEVLSVQSGTPFTYQIDLPEPPPPEDPEDPPGSGTTSSLVTWTCTASPCPWGSSDSGHALVWPASANPSSTRLGYTVSGGIYLAANRANGAIVWIDAGSATLFAGTPGASSHLVLTTLSVGNFYEVSGLAVGETLSVQSGSAFTYQISLPEPPPPEDPEEPTDPATPAEFVTWQCTWAPCPWGNPLTGHAVVWPATSEPSVARLGYTASRGIYLDASRANGTTVRAESGSATLFAGYPGASSHRVVTTINVGDTYQVAGLASGEVLSVQSEYGFTYSATVPDVPQDPDDGEIVDAELAIWRCALPGCTSAPWYGAVISWPSWAAYNNNNRAGEQSREVFSTSDTPLYPYMGSWASGCEVTVKSGTVIIIEWERGTDVWRETWLNPGDSHTIQLVGSENGAMIEAPDYSPGFRASLKNCTPQPLP